MYSLLLGASAVLGVAGPVPSPQITGQYLEVRTCDVYTGACFANADTGLAGRQAVLAWKVERGTLDSARLDGLGVVAVVASTETLGQKLHCVAKSVLIVDERADSAQRAALVRLAKQQAGSLLGNVIAVRSGAVDLEICPCKGNACAKLSAASVRVETRCLDVDHDRGCGNDCNFYPPLSKGVLAKAAMATEHSFTGKDFNETWSDAERRGAYVGSFVVR